MLDWLKKQWDDAFLRQYVVRDTRTGEVVSDKYINAHSKSDALEIACRVFDVPAEFLSVEDDLTDIM